MSSRDNVTSLQPSTWPHCRWMCTKMCLSMMRSGQLSKSKPKAHIENISMWHVACIVVVCLCQPTGRIEEVWTQNGQSQAGVCCSAFSLRFLFLFRVRLSPLQFGFPCRRSRHYRITWDPKRVKWTVVSWPQYGTLRATDHKLLAFLNSWLMHLCWLRNGPFSS